MSMLYWLSDLIISFVLLNGPIDGSFEAFSISSSNSGVKPFSVRLLLSSKGIERVFTALQRNMRIAVDVSRPSSSKSLSASFLSFGSILICMALVMGVFGE